MNSISHQHGATLIVSLIMLVVLTLLVVSGIRFSSSNMRIAGNMQAQEEAATLAQQVIEQIISNNDFTKTPPLPQNFDINNDSVNDFTVTIAATCLHSLQALRNEPIPNDCFGEGTPACFWSGWNVQSVARDIKTGATATINQGINVLIGRTSALMNCGAT